MSKLKLSGREPIVETSSSRLSDAQICRYNQWTAGTELFAAKVRVFKNNVLAHVARDVRIRLTAIGETLVLGRQLTSGVVGLRSAPERVWNLHDADWRDALAQDAERGDGPCGDGRPGEERPGEEGAGDGGPPAAA